VHGGVGVFLKGGEEEARKDRDSQIIVPVSGGPDNGFLTVRPSVVFFRFLFSFEMFAGSGKKQLNDLVDSPPR
jgi:hypothetical protein